MAQVLDKQVGIVAAGDGTATFTFQAPPTGFWWTGTLNCSSAPTGAVFVATIGATQWGQWGGNSVYGPVQSQANRQLVVTATGLVPGTTYVMTFLGQEQISAVADVVWPSANSTALTTQIGQPNQVAAGNITSGGYLEVVVPDSSRTLVLYITALSGGAAPTNVQIGQFTAGSPGGVLFYNGAPYLPSNTFGGWLIICPVAACIFPALQVVVTGTDPAGYSVTVIADSALYDESTYYNGQATTASVVQPTSGTYKLVDGPARIISATLDVDNAEGYMIWTDAAGVNHRMMHIVSASTANPGLTQAFTPNTILPDGASISAVMATAAGAHAINASVTYAYP